MWNIEKIVKKGDYLYAVVKGHPNSTKNNYVLMHRVVMENHLGRLLNTNEVVHHKDGNKHNNTLANLEVLDLVEHSKKHMAECLRKIMELKCPECGIIFKRYHNQVVYKKAKYGTFCSNKCRGRFSSKVQHHGLTAEMESAVSVNIQKTYMGKLDNTEETKTMGSVETKRTQPEMVKL